MELLEKQLELNNEIRAKEELQRDCTQTRQQLTETETYVINKSLLCNVLIIRGCLLEQFDQRNFTTLVLLSHFIF